MNTATAATTTTTTTTTAVSSSRSGTPTAPAAAAATTTTTTTTAATTTTTTTTTTGTTTTTTSTTGMLGGRRRGRAAVQDVGVDLADVLDEPRPVGVHFHAAGAQLTAHGLDGQLVAMARAGAPVVGDGLGTEEHAAAGVACGEGTVAVRRVGGGAFGGRRAGRGGHLWLGPGPGRRSGGHAGACQQGSRFRPGRNSSSTSARGGGCSGSSNGARNRARLLLRPQSLPGFGQSLLLGVGLAMDGQRQRGGATGGRLGGGSGGRVFLRPAVRAAGGQVGGEGRTGRERFSADATDGPCLFSLLLLLLLLLLD